MENTTTPAADGTNAATTAPAQATPVLDAIKTALGQKDAQIKSLTDSTAATIADLTAKLSDAVSNGAALQGKISALQGTIDTLHDALAEYQAIEVFLGLPITQ